MEKKSYLGYRVKAANLKKLEAFVSGKSSLERLPSVKPMKLNKK